MSINILHISDLHFGTESQTDKNATRYSEAFVSTFIKKVKKYTVNYIMVSGDIANSSLETEYEKASKFLNKVVKELKVPKENVLICMGNHDISWDILKEKEHNGVADNKLFMENEKYNYFKKFYDEFYKDGDKQIRQFKLDSVFFEVPDNKQKVLFLGINTCYHESNKEFDHYGYIDQVNFEDYMNSIDKQYDDYVRCLIMHHNPMDLCWEKNVVKNWNEINNRNLGYPFIVFCGHIHGSDITKVKKEDDNSIYYISVGSLLQKNSLGKFNLYTITDDSSCLEIKYFNFHDDVNSSNLYWQEQTDSPASKRVLLKQNVEKQDLFDRMMSHGVEKTKQKLETPQKQDTNKPYNNSILDEIKNHHLYYSGHFHWDTDGNGENSKFKSHGYIDINHLVSHIESLETISKLFKEKINEIQNNTKPSKTLMVAIGLECSVIGARLSVLFPNFDYSYIPRKQKANDHSDVEKEIGFSNFDTVILIKDITFNADEAIEIIGDRFKDKTIHLISLFYCGNKNKKNEILSGIENAHFYSLIDDIEIPQCDVSESECPIINNKLQTIYKC